MSCLGTGIVCPLSSLVWWQLEQGRCSGCTAFLSSDQKEQLNFNHIFHTDIKSLMGNRPVILKASHKLTNDLQQYQWFLYQSNETVATRIERLAMLCVFRPTMCRSHTWMLFRFWAVLLLWWWGDYRAWLELYAELTMMPMKICNHVGHCWFLIKHYFW